MKPVFAICFVALLITNTFSQTGPGGIESTNGTSNLKIWFDADQITDVVNSNNLTTWLDLSGNDNHASQSNPNDKPNWFSNAVNGFSYLRFDGDESLDGTLDNALNAPATMITVCFFDSLNQPVGDNDYVFSIGSQNLANSTMNIARREAGADLNKYYSYDGTNINLGPVITGQDWSILTNVQSNTVPYQNMYYNGASQSVDDFSTTSLSTNTDFRIADWVDSPGGAFHFTGKISEIILFNKELNTAELNIIHSYLAAKYDISNANDKYAGDDAGNGSNDRNVIGVGVEADGVNLEAHAAGIQITQVSGFETSDYILLGHSFKENDINTTDVGGGYDARWERAFFVDVSRPIIALHKK